MLYVLWAFLNLGLFLTFIGICFRATKLIRERLGFLASIVFVFGLLAFVRSAGRTNDVLTQQTSQGRKWTFASRDSLVASTLKFKPVSIDETLLSKTDLLVLYGREKTSATWRFAEATSTKTGFASGHVWKPAIITIRPTATATTFSYQVSGVLEWTLLGATIYTESKRYSGFITITAKD